MIAMNLRGLKDCYGYPWMPLNYFTLLYFTLPFCTLQHEKVISFSVVWCGVVVVWCGVVWGGGG